MEPDDINVEGVIAPTDTTPLDAATPQTQPLGPLGGTSSENVMVDKGAYNRFPGKIKPEFKFQDTFSEQDAAAAGGETSNTVGLEALADPLFLAEMREYFATRGKYFKDDEKLIEAFYSDQTWSNFNTIGMGLKSNEVNDIPEGEGGDRTKEIMVRMKQVYDNTPMFWQEGGRGAAGLGQLVLAAVADPINLIGLGAGGATAKTAITAGKTTAAAIGKGVVQGAVAEGGLNAIIGAGQQNQIQKNELEIGAIDEIDQGRNVQAGFMGGTTGGVLGGAFGGVGAKWVTRAGKDVSIRADALKAMGYTKEDVSVLSDESVRKVLTEGTARADNPEIDGLLASEVPVPSPVKETIGGDLPATEGDLPIRAVEEEIDLAPYVGRIEETIRLHENDARIAGIDGDEAAVAEATARITELQSIKDQIKARIEADDAARAEAQTGLDVPLAKTADGSPAPKPKADIDPSVEAAKAAARAEHLEAIKAFSDNNTEENRLLVETTAAKMQAAGTAKAPAKAGDTGAAAPEAPLEKPDMVSEEAWAVLDDETKAQAAAKYNEILSGGGDDAEGKVRANRGVSKAEREMLFGDVDVPEEIAPAPKPDAEDAAPELADFGDIKFSSIRSEVVAREFGLTPEDLKGAKGSAKNGGLNSPDLEAIAYAKNPPPAGVTFSGGTVGAYAYRMVNDGVLDWSDFAPKNYNRAAVDKIAEIKAGGGDPAPVAKKKGPTPKIYKSDAQAASVQKLLEANGKDEDWLVGLVKNERVPEISAGQDGKLKTTSVAALRKRLKAENAENTATPAEVKGQEKVAKRTKQRAAVSKAADDIPSQAQVRATLDKVYEIMDPVRFRVIRAASPEGAREILRRVDPEFGDRVAKHLDDADNLLRMDEGAEVPEPGKLTTTETKRAKMIMGAAVKTEIARFTEETGAAPSGVERVGMEIQAAIDATAVVINDRGKFIPKRSDTGTSPLARMAEPGESTTGRESTDPTLTKKAIRVATKEGIPLGRDGAADAAKRLKTNKPLQFVAEQNTRVQDGPKADAGEILWYNPIKGKGSGVWRNPAIMTREQNSLPKAVQGDVPKKPTIDLLNEAVDDLIAGGKLEDFLSAIDKLDLDKAVSQKFGAPNLPAVAEDGRVLAIRYVGDDTDAPVRVLTKKQTETGGDVSTLLGKADKTLWEVGYVKAGATSNSAMARETFGKAGSDGPLRMFLTAAEASDEMLPPTAVTRWSQFSADIDTLPLTKRTRASPISPKRLFDELAKKMQDGTASVYELDFAVRTIEQSIAWARKATKEVDGTLPNGSKITDVFDFMERLYAFQQEVAPEPVRLDAARLEESQRSLAAMTDLFGPDEIVEALRIISLVADDGRAPWINRASGSGLNLTSNEIGIGAPNPAAPFPLPRIYALGHELGHWAYTNILTPSDRLEFWRVIKEKYTDADGLVDELALEAKLPLPLYKMLNNGIPMTGNMQDSPAEFFANQFMMWIARNHLDPDLKSKPEFSKYAQASSFWGKVSGMLQQIIDRFFFDKDAIEPGFEELFARIIPDPEDARALEGGVLQPKTAGGKAILRRVSSVRMLHSELEMALEADSAESIVKTSYELANELYGIAATNARKKTPAFAALEKAHPNARAVYGRIYEALGFKDIDKYANSPVEDGLRVVEDPSKAADRLREIFETSDDGVEFFLDGNMKAILGKAKAAFNRIAGEDIVSMGRDFELKKRSVDARSKAYRKMKASIGKQAKAKRRGKTDTEILTGKKQAGRTAAKAGLNEPATKELRSTEYDTFDVRSAPEAKLQRLARENEGNAFGKRLQGEIYARENSEPVHDDLDQAVITSPNVGEAISRERDHIKGWSEDNVSPKARASMNDVQRKMTHRNGERQHVMRTLYYRIANIAGVADPESKTPLTGFFELEKARATLRPVATNLVGTTTGSEVAPMIPVRNVMKVLMDQQVHVGDDVVDASDEEVLSATLTFLSDISDEAIEDVPLEMRDTVLRLADATGYVLNGQAPARIRKAFPNLDRYRSVFRDEDGYLEMREADVDKMMANLRDRSMTTGEEYSAMSKGVETSHMLWHNSSPSRKDDIIKFLGAEPNEVMLATPPKTYFIATGPDNRVQGYAGPEGKTSMPHQSDTVYGRGVKLYSDPYGALDTSTLSYVNLDRLYPDFLEQLKVPKREASMLLAHITMRQQHVGFAGAARRKASRAHAAGDILRAEEHLATARMLEEQVEVLNDKILNGFKGDSEFLGEAFSGRVRGLKAFGVESNTSQPVYARGKKPANFTEKALYTMGNGEGEVKGLEEMILPLIGHITKKYVSNLRDDATMRKFLTAMYNSSQEVRDLGEALPDRMSKPLDQINVKGVLSGREMFQIIAHFVGEGSPKKGASLIKMGLRDLGYDTIIGTDIVKGEGASAMAQTSNLWGWSGSGEVETRVDFIMPLEAHKQVKSIHAERFEAGRNELGDGWLEMDEGSRLANPAIMKTLASTGPLKPADVQFLVDALQRMGAPAEAGTGMAKMAQGQVPTIKEANTLQKVWNYGTAENSQALRRNGVSWFADWIKPERSDGTGHFERHAGNVGVAIHPITLALKVLPDHAKGLGGKLSRWASSASDYQIGRIGKEAKSRQPDSHKKIVAAMRRDPGSIKEGDLTEGERKAYEELRTFFSTVRKQLDDAGVMSGEIEPYFPQVWNAEKIQQNYNEFVSNLSAYFLDENRANEVNRMSPETAMTKARRVASKLIDDDGMYVPPPGGGSRSPQGDHVDFQRLIRLDKFQNHLDTLGNFLEDNLEAITAKYADTSMRRIDFAKQFGEQSHAFYDYLSVMNEPSDAAIAIGDLLSTNKVSKRTLKTPGVNENLPTDEIVLERLTEMPFSPNETRTAEEQATRAYGAAKKAMATYEKAGPDAARSYLMNLYPAKAPERARKVYAKRVDGIVGAIGDRLARGDKPLSAVEVEHAQSVMRSVQRRSPTSGGWLSEAGRTSSKWVRNFNSITMLSYTTLTSLGDLALPIMRSGNMQAYSRAIARFASQPEYRNMIKQTGVAVDNIIHERMTNLYGSSFGKNTVAFFNMTGLTPWTQMNREIAGAVGFEWFKSEYDIALKAFDPKKALTAQTPRFKKAYRVLRAYGLDGMLANAERIDAFENMADKPALREGIIKFANEAIFTPNPNDIPLWAQSPVGSIMFQLKSFPLMMARYSKDVWRGALTVDPLTGGGRRMVPPALFLTMGPASGALALSAKDILQMRGEDQTASVRERLLSDNLKSLGVDVELPEDADRWMGTYYEGFMMMGGLGLMAELLHDSVQQADQGGAYGAMRFFGTVGGPSVGTAWNAFDVAAGAMNAATHGADDGTGKERAAVRAVAGRLPVLGGNRAFKEGITDAVAGEPAKGGSKSDGWKGWD